MSVVSADRPAGPDDGSATSADESATPADGAAASGGGSAPGGSAASDDDSATPADGAAASAAHHAESGDGPPGVASRRKSAVLWGLIGALSFGVLYQGYVLLGASFEWVPFLGGMVAVGAVTTALAYWFEVGLRFDGA